MIKYIASDLDGTLLHNGAQHLPEEIFDGSLTVEYQKKYSQVA